MMNIDGIMPKADHAIGIER